MKQKSLHTKYGFVVASATQDHNGAQLCIEIKQRTVTEGLVSAVKLCYPKPCIHSALATLEKFKYADFERAGEILNLELRKRTGR